LEARDRINNMGQKIQKKKNRALANKRQISMISIIKITTLLAHAPANRLAKSMAIFSISIFISNPEICLFLPVLFHGFNNVLKSVGTGKKYNQKNFIKLPQILKIFLIALV